MMSKAKSILLFNNMSRLVLFNFFMLINIPYDREKFAEALPRINSHKRNLLSPKTCLVINSYFRTSIIRQLSLPLSCAVISSKILTSFLPENYYEMSCTSQVQLQINGLV